VLAGVSGFRLLESWDNDRWKQERVYASGTLDGYFSSYVYCEPDFEARDFFEEFTTVEVSIDFVATSKAEKVRATDSVNVPGMTNQHARISGERRSGEAVVTYNGITRYSDDAILYSFRYSYHSSGK
jgi:hypothetical protein